MKKILKNTKKTREYLESLPKMYLIGFWANYGVLETYYSKRQTKDGIPLVYVHYDGNGTCDLWELVPITDSTCGQCIAYTPYKELACHIVASLCSYADSEMYYAGNKASVRYDSGKNELIGVVNTVNNGCLVFRSKTCNGIVNAFHKTVDDAPGEVREFLGEKFKTIEEKKDECE